MVTLIKWLIMMIGVHIQEKQNTGENMMFLTFTNQFEGEGGGGGGGLGRVRLSKALPPHPSDLALSRHVNFDIKGKK